jgi:hypothetical protein
MYSAKLGQWPIVTMGATAAVASADGLTIVKHIQPTHYMCKVNIEINDLQF